MICWYGETNVTPVFNTTLLSNWLTHCMLLPNKNGIGMIYLYEVCVRVQTFVDFGSVNWVESCITPLFCHYCQHILGQWKEICAVWR
jgi:hypothetical protein